MSKTAKPAADAPVEEATAQPEATTTEEAPATETAPPAEGELATAPDPHAVPTIPSGEPASEPDDPAQDATATKGDDILLAAAQDGEQPAATEGTEGDELPEGVEALTTEELLASIPLKEILTHLLGRVDHGGVANGSGQFAWQNHAIVMDTL
jgi:hypothetical protein